MDSKDVIELAANFVTTLLGVGLGAWLAFRIERNKAKEERSRAIREAIGEENARRASAVNLAVLQLGRMYSAIAEFRKEVVDPVRKSPAPWYEMSPTDIYYGSQIEFDYPSLQFLFSSADPGILAVLAIEEARFANLVLIVNRRSAVHLNELQPRQEKAGLQGSAQMHLLENALGPRIVGSMKSYTPAIIEFTDRGVASTLEVLDALRTAAAPMVGSNKLISFEPLP